MQTIPYYGFIMPFNVNDYSNEEQAHLIYTDTKDKIERNFRETIPYIKGENTDVLSSVYIGGNKINNFFIRVLVVDEKPNLSFIRKINNNYVVLHELRERLIRQIDDETWNRLNFKLENGLTIEKLAIGADIDKNILFTQDITDPKRNSLIKNKEFSSRDVCQLLNMFNSVKEGDITYEHSARVGENIGRFCKEMGYSEEMQVRWRFAGYLHDIGKLFIPPEIINKKSSLEIVEKEIINLHTQLGTQFLKTIGAPTIYQQTSLLHHQFTNNYPCNVESLKNISEDAKQISTMFSIIDIYDAMINKRQYHEAFKSENILDNIEKNFKYNENETGLNLLQKFKEGLNKGLYDFSKDAVILTEERFKDELLTNAKHTPYGLNEKIQEIQTNTNIDANNKIFKFLIKKIDPNISESDIKQMKTDVYTKYDINDSEYIGLDIMKEYIKDYLYSSYFASEEKSMNNKSGKSNISYNDRY